MTADKNGRLVAARGTRARGGAFTMTEQPDTNKRRYGRAELTEGIWVAWQGLAKKHLSRIQSLGLGGLFIRTPNPPALGTVLKLVFEVPSGDVRARAVVRNVKPGEGMGIEFTGMNYEDRARLSILLKKLLK